MKQTLPEGETQTC